MVAAGWNDHRMHSAFRLAGVLEFGVAALQGLQQPCPQGIPHSVNCRSALLESVLQCLQARSGDASRALGVARSVVLRWLVLQHWQTCSSHATGHEVQRQQQVVPEWFLQCSG
jgi:hypothetical protein